MEGRTEAARHLFERTGLTERMIEETDTALLEHIDRVGVTVAGASPEG
ncbi:MAG: hypothetical protein ACLFPW_12630 [Spirochaetaceae bacterium]